MKKRIISIILAIMCVSSCLFACAEGELPEDTDGTSDGTAEASVSDTVKSESDTDETDEPELESLCAKYADCFDVGVALPDSVFGAWKKYSDAITENFNSYTCENEMKPDYILDQSASRSKLSETYENAAVKFTAAKKLMTRAEKEGAKVRLHTLVWHSQTPDWFFTEDYTNEGALVSRETMLKRMENYIKNVLEYYDTEYPGMICAVDVVNEAIDPGNGDATGVRKVDNKWYDTVGADYIYWAFYYADKYAPDYMKLYYNDYSCMYKVDEMLEILTPMLEEGIIDGIGMQSHLSADTNIKQHLAAAKRFCEAGFELSVTELDIGIKDTSALQLKKQKNAYKTLISGLAELARDGYEVQSVTVWGLNDKLTWRAGDYPLLYDENMEKKSAYYGFLGE